MSVPANRIGAPQRLKTAEVGIKTPQSLETALEIPLSENYRPATSIGSGLFRPSLNLSDCWIVFDFMKTARPGSVLPKNDFLE